MRIKINSEEGSIVLSWLISFLMVFMLIGAVFSILVYNVYAQAVVSAAKESARTYGLTYYTDGPSVGEKKAKYAAIETMKLHIRNVNPDDVSIQINRNSSTVDVVLKYKNYKGQGTAYLEKGF